MLADYINDGVYGAFNCTMFDHQVVHPKVLTLGGTFVSSASSSSSASPSASAADLDETTYEACSIWGPTCDSIDCVSARSYLPTDKVQVGDWLKWENMGAYTICAASQFNGFKQSKVIYTIEADLETENIIRGLLQ
jgi:ornithine decarboxylase